MVLIYGPPYQLNIVLYHIEYGIKPYDIVMVLNHIILVRYCTLVRINDVLPYTFNYGTSLCILPYKLAYGNLP